MERSIFLAQLIGLYSIIIGFSMLIKRKMLMGIFHEIFTSRALSYIMGVVIVIIGLLLVLNHNIWKGTREVIITIVGWFVLLEGIAYVFFSKKTLAKSLEWVHNKKVYYAIALVYIVLGAYLTYSGFFVR